MMFQSVGHRPAIDQQIQLGAEANGKLTALAQHYVNHVSIEGDYDEGCGEATGFLYSCPNLVVTGGLAQRNVGVPHRDARPRRCAWAVCAGERNG